MMALAAIGYIVTSVFVYTFDHKQKYILTHWITVEAVSFPFLILYLVLQGYYLKWNISEKKDEAAMKKGEGVEMEAMGAIEGQDTTKVSASQEGLLNKDTDKDEEETKLLDPLNDSMASESLEKKL